MSGHNYLMIATPGIVILDNQTFTNIGGGDLLLAEFAEEVPPVFTLHPANVRLGFTVGESKTFKAEARSFSLAHYQCQRSGTNLPGETNLFLTITNAQFADRGQYWLVASNVFGISTSRAATLDIYYPGEIRSIGSGEVSVAPQAHGFYSAASEIVVTAIPASGVEFLRWSGDATGHENPLRFQVTSNFLVNAVFSDFETNIIIDEAQAQFTGIGVSQANSSPDAYRGTFRALFPPPGARFNSNTTATAVYRPEIVKSAYYDIFIWYPKYPISSKVAPWSITTPNGTTNIWVNQTTNTGKWVLLAESHFFPAGTNNYIQLSNGTSDPNRLFIVDAIRVVGSSKWRNPIIGSSKFSARTFSFQIQSGAFNNYDIEASDDLSAWALIATLGSTNSTAEFLDSAEPLSRRFYRALIK